MTNTGPRVTERRPLHVAMLCYPGAQATCIHGLTDLFTYADHFARMHAANASSSTPCPATPGDLPFVQLTHWRQTSLDSDFDCESRDGSSATSLVIVPASQLGPPTPGYSAPMTACLQRMHASGAAIAAVCGGVFLLAEAGVLAGRRATTHWMFAAEFSRRFPSVRMEVDRIVVDDGDLVTAGGVLAWADLGLTLVDRFLGRTVMCSTARFMLMDPPRREQSLYGEFLPPLTHGDKSVLAIQHWLQANVSAELSNVALAHRAGLGERTFLRRFVKATGMRPSEYHQRLRIMRSRELLEFSRDTVDRIAMAAGYADPRSFRRIFKRVIGLSPAEYRRRFQRTASNNAFDAMALTA